MKTKTPWIFFLILSLLNSACTVRNSNQVDEIDANSTTSPTPTQSPQVESMFISPCDLISIPEMEEIFSESPLFLSEENGSCVIRNQWDTRSIWFLVYQDEQALSAMQWNTRHLISGWNNEEMKQRVEEIILDENNQTLRSLQDARLVIFEDLEYRWERLFTFGDIAYWIINPRAFKGIFDVVEGEIFFQIGYSGFMAAQIQPQLEDVSEKIFSRLPGTFFIEFDFPDEGFTDQNNNAGRDIPEIVDLTMSSQEIFFGSFCEEETTTIRAMIENPSLVDNVFLVYRLVSNDETNDNWKTIFMDQVSDQNWEITLNAENSFSAYQLVDGAVVEYSIAIIYEVNSVSRGSTLRDITVSQCKQ